MTNDDLIYIKALLSAGSLSGPVLELGGGYGGTTCREAVEAAGLAYKATDMMPGNGVDYVADFEAPDCPTAFGGATFGSVFVLNVLEHVFRPIEVLDNAVRLTRAGGKIVVITPSMWPVHNYPIDCQRLLPDWYRTYAQRNANVRLIEEHFEFVGRGPVADFKRNKESNLPPPKGGETYRAYSRAIHKLFNTSGRGHWASNHSAIGAVFEKNL